MTRRHCKREKQLCLDCEVTTPVISWIQLLALSRIAHFSVIKRMRTFCFFTPLSRQQWHNRLHFRCKYNCRNWRIVKISNIQRFCKLLLGVELFLRTITKRKCIMWYWLAAVYLYFDTHLWKQYLRTKIWDRGDKLKEERQKITVSAFSDNVCITSFIFLQ